MIHIIYIYLIINSFITGWYLGKHISETLFSKVISFSVLILFGAISVPLYYMILKFAGHIGWVTREIRFIYRFYCTDYWDKIMLDDNYSEKYKTTKEKLERSAKVVRTASKQVKRHNRLIQKRYGKN